MSTASALPLSGLRVLEFTHAVMGPTAGLLLADLGAEVIYIEPPQGDPTRRLKGFSKKEMLARCEAAGIPFAPIARPEDLFDDPQLNQTGNKGLVPMTLPDGTRTRLPRLPLEMGGHDFGLRHDPPAIGADAEALLVELGYHTDEIRQLRDAETIA